MSEAIQNNIINGLIPSTLDVPEGLRISSLINIKYYLKMEITWMRRHIVGVTSSILASAICFLQLKIYDRGKQTNITLVLSVVFFQIDVSVTASKDALQRYTDTNPFINSR